MLWNESQDAATDDYKDHHDENGDLKLDEDAAGDENPQASDGEEARTDDDDDDNPQPQQHQQGDAAEEPTNATTTTTSPSRPLLYKSTRFKGYLTLLLASIIYYDAARKSDSAYAAATVPATSRQQTFAVAVASISMTVTGAVVGMHLDSFSCLRSWWRKAFCPDGGGGSRLECALAVCIFTWWTVVVGWQTSVQGVAGDGRQQYSLYYSAWVCVYAGFFQVLEPWWVAAGWNASLSAFVQSWPHRAPGWLCILTLSLVDLVWLLDLWRNHPALRDRQETQFLYFYLQAVPTGHWQFLVSLSVFTIVSATVWVLVELFRETKADNGVARKSQSEVIIEGLCILILLALWIPSIMLATTSGGVAALVGNAYFFSWAVVIFLAETAVWYVHDLRDRMHQSLAEKAREYRHYQRQAVMAHGGEEGDDGNTHQHHSNRDNDNRIDNRNQVAAPEFLDALSEF